MTTIEDDFKALRRYSRQEVAAILNVKDSTLKRLVSKRAVPHQRTGEPGPHQRGVWSTYDDILETARMLPKVLSARHANSRAEGSLADQVPAPKGAPQQVEPGADVAVSEPLPDELLEAWRGCRVGWHSVEDSPMVRVINLERGRQACPGSEGRVDVRFSDDMFHGCVCTTRAAYAVPAHVPSGAALAALMLSEEARGVRGLDVLRRSVDRAPPIAA